MPSKSDSQKNFFRMVKGVQAGEIPEKDVSDRITKVAKSMDPKDVDDFVKENTILEEYSDADYEMLNNAFRSLRFDRKASDWDQIQEPRYLPPATKKAILWLLQKGHIMPLRYPLEGFRSPPPGDYFIAKSPDGKLFIVDTQGYDYVRLALALPREFYKYENDSKYADLFDENTLRGMYESLKKQAFGK